MITGIPRGCPRRRRTPIVEISEKNVGMRAMKVNRQCRRKRSETRKVMAPTISNTREKPVKIISPSRLLNKTGSKTRAKSLEISLLK
jgi:hypothetical protein